MKYVVKESCKAGPNNYLVPGQVVEADKDDEAFRKKLLELADKGFIVPESLEKEGPPKSPLDTLGGENPPSISTDVEVKSEEDPDKPAKKATHGKK